MLHLLLLLIHAALCSVLLVATTSAMICSGTLTATICFTSGWARAVTSSSYKYASCVFWNWVGCWKWSGHDTTDGDSDEEQSRLHIDYFSEVILGMAKAVLLDQEDRLKGRVSKLVKTIECEVDSESMMGNVGFIYTSFT